MAKLVLELTINSLTNEQVDDEGKVCQDVETAIKKSGFANAEVTDIIDSELDN